MLRIVVPSLELFDEEKSEFVHLKEQVLQLEHSLVSLSKWESKWKKPFLGKDEKTTEETIDYIRCMTITQNVDPSVYLRLTSENIEKINAYINDPMTATTFSRRGPQRTKRLNREVVTSELVYYWMVFYNIPPEYQKWHLNRLLTLIQICTIKNEKQKPRSKKEIMSENAALNAARRKQLGTKG